MAGSDSEDDLESLRLAALRSMQPPGAVPGSAAPSCQQPSRRGGSSMPLLATAPPRPALLQHQSRPAVWQAHTAGPPPGAPPPGVWMNQQQQQQLPPPHQPPPHLQQHPPPPQQQPHFSRPPPLLAHPLLSTLQQLLPTQQPFQLMQQPQQLHCYPTSSHSAGYRQQLSVSRRGRRGSWNSNATSRLQTPSRRPIATDTAPASRPSNRSNARRLHKNERSKFGRIDHSDSDEEEEDELSSTASVSAPSTAEVDDSVVPPTSTPAVETSAAEVVSSTASLTTTMSAESTVNSVETTETSAPVSNSKRTSTTPDPAASSQAAAEAPSTEDDEEEDDDADVIDMGIGDDDFDKMLAEFEDFVDNPQLKGSNKSSGGNATAGGMPRKRRRKDHRGSAGRAAEEDPSDVRLKPTSDSKTADLDKQNPRHEPAKSSGASSDPPVLDPISPPGPEDKSSLGRVGRSPTASRRPTSPARRPRSPLLGRAPPQHLRHPLSPGQRGLPLSPARVRRVSPPPRRLSPPPRRLSPPPRRFSPPPRRFSPPPRRMSPFPRRSSPPPRRFSPPPRRFSPPSRHLSPFSRRFSPPSPLRRSTLSPERRRSPPAPIALTQDEFIRRIQLGLPLRDSSPSTCRRSRSRSPSRRRVSLSPTPPMTGPVMSRRMRSPEQRSRHRPQVGRSTSPSPLSSSSAAARTRSTSPGSLSWCRGHPGRGERRLASPPLSTTNRTADRRQEERVDVKRTEEERRRKLHEEEEHRKKQQEEERKKRAKEEADRAEFEERLKRLSTPDRERVLKRQAKFQRNVPITGQPKTIRLGSNSSAGAQQVHHPQAPVSVGSASQKPRSATNSTCAAVSAETDTQQSEADQLLHQLDEELAALEAELLTESTNGAPTPATTAEVAVEKKPARVRITMDPVGDQRKSDGVVVKHKHRPKELSPDVPSGEPGVASVLKARSGKRRRREHSTRESGSRRVVVVASSLEPDDATSADNKLLKHKQDSSLGSLATAALPGRRAPLVVSKSSGQKTLDSSSARSIFSRLGSSAVVADTAGSSEAALEDSGRRTIGLKRKRRSEVLAPQDSDRPADDGGIIGAQARRNVIATDPIRHHLRKAHSSVVSKRRRKGVSGVDCELHRRDKYD